VSEREGAPALTVRGILERVKPRRVAAVPLPRVFAVSMVKDEADIIGATVANLAAWGVEQIIVADNNSTDNTRRILEDLDVLVLDDPEVGYNQGRKMTRLLRHAEQLGADWVIPFDADEWWYAPEGTSIPAELATMPGWASWGSVVMWNHFCTAEDPDDPDPTRRMRWRQEKLNPLQKVVVRAGHGLTLDEGNHRVFFPDDVWAPGPDVLAIRHFPYRSADQMVRKVRNGVAALEASDLDESYSTHWRDYGRILEFEGEDSFRKNVFQAHFFYPNPHHSGMVLDPAPRASWRR
jgi:glycosyltransferase involved in cell wall biosynthesis